jgi:hypothetical protein
MVHGFSARKNGQTVVIAIVCTKQFMKHLDPSSSEGIQDLCCANENRL